MDSENPWTKTVKSAKYTLAESELLLSTLFIVSRMLFNLGMKAKEMDDKHQQGLKLWNAGKSQECANIWMDLADYGHLDSIEQLVYIFLDQKEFEEVARLIDCAKNPNEPIILYLKARLIEERDGVEAAMDSFKTAAEAGNPNSYLFLLEVAIEVQSIEDAKFCLSKLAEHSEFFETPSAPANYYKELKERAEELIADLSYSGSDSETANDVLKALATNPSCPEEILTKLAKESDPEVRSAVAENASTHADLLINLAKDKDKEVRTSVARNVSTPAETLAVMAKSAFLRETIAENSAISIELLKRLSVDKNENVRSAIAQNQITPPEILKILASDNGYMVRYNVALNPTTPPEALATLAKDDYYMIRARVASNRNAPPELLKGLASDESDEARFSAVLNLSAPLDSVFRIKLLKSLGTKADEYGYGRGFLGQNPDTPVEILKYLSEEKNHVVRSGVAENPAVPLGILKVLAKEESAKGESQIVQARVAENPSIPESLRIEIIEGLVSDPDPWIRNYVAWNKLAPTRVLRALAKDNDPQVRSAVARNPATPIEVVVSLAEDEKFSVKAAVAENPKTPEEVLRKLASI